MLTAGQSRVWIYPVTCNTYISLIYPSNGKYIQKEEKEKDEV